MTWMGLWRES